MFRWLSDVGYLTKPEDLGITQIFALQQRDLVPQSEGRIFLGPLECVEASKIIIIFNTHTVVLDLKSRRVYYLKFGLIVLIETRHAAVCRYF